MPKKEPDVIIDESGFARCWWCGDTPEYVAYHDDEWGRPILDDRTLFEKVCLEGFQSGLSWLTILRKREGFRKAFRDFEPKRVSRFGERDVQRLLADAGIVRHRGKIEATINNAKMALALLEEFDSLASYFWGFQPGPKSRPTKLTRATLSKLTTTDEAVALSKDLKKRGWKFVGPTTMYAFMQAMGMVNDHLDACTVRRTVEQAQEKARR